MMTTILRNALCFLAITSPLLSSEEISVEVEKIDLIRYEVAYARYIAWQTKKNLLDKQDGLEWVEAILEIVEKQLEEIAEES